MGLPALPTYLDYLDLEQSTGVKHEWREGSIVAMAGGTLAHADLGGRLYAQLSVGLKGKPCRPWNSDAKVRIPAEGVSTYPDLSIVCGPVIRDSVDANAITNPTVIVEVLSEGTERYDRGEKFSYYQSLPSLREYILVSAERVEIDHYVRQDDGSWSFRRLHAADALVLPSVEVRIPLAEIYDGIELEPRTPRGS